MHGTVRDPNKESSVGHLKALPGASERLKLFAADLLEVRSTLPQTGCQEVTPSTVYKNARLWSTYSSAADRGSIAFGSLVLHFWLLASVQADLVDDPAPQ